MDSEGGSRGGRGRVGPFLKGFFYRPGEVVGGRGLIRAMEKRRRQKQTRWGCLEGIKWTEEMWAEREGNYE